jgi:hypothetical protein
MLQLVNKQVIDHMEGKKKPLFEFFLQKLHTSTIEETHNKKAEITKARARAKQYRDYVQLLKSYTRFHCPTYIVHRNHISRVDTDQ